MGRKSALTPRKFDPPPVDLALTALAEAQDAVFTLTQARETGLGPRAVQERVSAGRLFRLHQGVYSVVPPKLLSVRGRRMAAVLACGDGAALSHLTAAVHVGFVTGAAPWLIDVTVPRRGGHHRHGIRIHRSTTLRPQDVQLVYGIPATSVARILLDLTGVIPARRVEHAMDEAGRQELLSLPALHGQIAHNRGRPEAARLQRIVQRWEDIWALTESELEKLFLRAMRGAGIPQPELQVSLDLNDGGPRIRADFLWRDARVIGETDGWAAHAEHFEADRRRDQRAARAGFQTIRVTRRHVVDEIDRLTATFAAVLEQRAAQR